MAIRKQQATATFSQMVSLSLFLPPLPAAASFLRAQTEKRRQKSQFFLSDGGLAARGEGDCGKAGRRGSDVVWPLALFRCSVPRTPGITKDYRATLWQPRVCFIARLYARACAATPMAASAREWTCACVFSCVCVPSGQLACQSLLSCLSHFSHSGELKQRVAAFHG